MTKSVLGKIPAQLIEKAQHIKCELCGGSHPQNLGATKIHCLPNLYRIKISHGYRLLVGLEQGDWQVMGIYSRQNFTTLLNRRRRK